MIETERQGEGRREREGEREGEGERGREMGGVGWGGGEIRR